MSYTPASSPPPHVQDTTTNAATDAPLSEDEQLSSPLSSLRSSPSASSIDLSNNLDLPSSPPPRGRAGAPSPPAYKPPPPAAPYKANPTRTVREAWEMEEKIERAGAIKRLRAEKWQLSYFHCTQIKEREHEYPFLPRWAKRMRMAQEFGTTTLSTRDVGGNALFRSLARRMDEPDEKVVFGPPVTGNKWKAKPVALGPVGVKRSRPSVISSVLPPVRSGSENDGEAGGDSKKDLLKACGKVVKGWGRGR